MITIRKLSKLPPVSALRKASRILQGFELEMVSNKNPNPIYLKDLISFISSSPVLNPDEHLRLSQITENFTKNGTDLIRVCNNLRHLLLKNLNEEPADWDFSTQYTDKTKEEAVSNRKILPFKIFLDDIRSPFNVGSIFRSSESFAVSKIFVSPGTADPAHKRALRTSMGCTDIVPWERISYQDLENKNIFALELKGEPIDQFVFPDSGTVIIGSEELGVSPECLTMADNSFGRVSIPISGIKGSINVSVAFGILMYNWYTSVVKTQ